MKHNNLSTFSGRKLVPLYAALVVSGVLALPSSGKAQVIVLTSGNSSATVDISGGGAGMNDWVVDGGDQLAKQWFYFRVGSGGTAAPVDTIGTLSYTTPSPDQLKAVYTGPNFSLAIRYKLTGGALLSGSSDVLESIMVTNYSGGNLDFHLFQYSDFDLGGTAGGDNVEIFDNGFGKYDFASQTEGLTEISETITQPPADRGEAAFYNSTLVNLTTIAGYDLNNTLTEGTGDVTWALQWDRNIPDGMGLNIFKDKGLSVTPIPEPCSMALIALGLGVYGLARRRQ